MAEFLGEFSFEFTFSLSLFLYEYMAIFPHMHSAITLSFHFNKFTPTSLHYMLPHMYYHTASQYSSYRTVVPILKTSKNNVKLSIKLLVIVSKHILYIILYSIGTYCETYI